MKKKISILLADDDKDDRFFFEKALNELSTPFVFETMEDGEKLMIWLLKNSNHLPDVLFLDLNMPRKNGSECLLEIKKHPKLKKMPVIIYSTSLHEEVANILYANGAHYYIKKPDYTELAKILQKAIGLITNNSDQPSRDKFVVS